MTYHPGLPNIGGMLRNLHPVLHSSQRCRNAIKEVPMVAFRRPKCLSDFLVRAKFRSAAKEEVTGTLKCGSNRCQICTFLCVGRTFRSKTNGKEFRINYNLNWSSKNVVYLLLVRYVAFNMLDPLPLLFGLGSIITEEGSMPISSCLLKIRGMTIFFTSIFIVRDT